MNTNLLMWIIVGVVIAVVISFVLYNVIHILKMPTEEKKKMIVTYLVGLVDAAEGAIGSGNGAQKLEQVEKWFSEKAPFIYKILLKLVGKDNLKDLIEEALKSVKENFGK